MKADWHLLYKGHISDMPGQDFSWTESVRYRGKGVWLLVVKETGILEGEEAAVSKHRYSTRQMLTWVLEQDGEDVEVSSDQSTDTEHDFENSPKVLGVRASRLLEISDRVDAQFCSRLLRGLANGTWPKPPKIIEVTGATSRAVWKGIFHPVFAVDTSSGPGYLYPPSADNTSRLILTDAVSNNQEWIVKLSNKNLKQTKEYDHDLALLLRGNGTDTK